MRTRSGIELNVEVDGPADAPVTLVLVHGWTLDLTTWGPVARELAGPGVRVVRYDHRGHGRSDAADPATMTLEQLADDLADVLDAHAPSGTLVVAGHSMGGMTLMALAERHPRFLPRVAGVALIASACGGLSATTLGLPERVVPLWHAAEQRLFRTRRWVTGRRMGNARTLSPALRWLLLGPRADREAIRATAESVAACRPLTVSGFRPALDAHERDEALAAFSRVPTVVLAGGRDRLTPLGQSRRICAALPSARLTIYPDAGHMLTLECATGVAERLRVLVRGAAARAAAA